VTLGRGDVLRVFSGVGRERLSKNICNRGCLGQKVEEEVARRQGGRFPYPYPYVCPSTDRIRVVVLTGRLRNREYPWKKKHKHLTVYAFELGGSTVSL